MIQTRIGDGMLIRELGHNLGGEQLQRIHHLVVLDAAVVYEENQVFHA